MTYVVTDFRKIWSMKGVHKITNEETSTEIAVYKDRVVFNGSNNSIDRVQNFDFKLITVSILDTEVKVHEGFYNKFLSVKDELFRFIDKKLEINFIGHSQGGALAHLASILYKERHNDCIVKCFAFGCPRVGNKDFATLYDKNITSYRIYYGVDPIPMLPFTLNYQHTKNPIWVQTNGDIIKQDRSKIKNGLILGSMMLSNCDLADSIQYQDHNYDNIMKYKDQIIQALAN